jgi:hypothetical protein
MILFRGALFGCRLLGEGMNTIAGTLAAAFESVHRLTHYSLHPWTFRCSPRIDHPIARGGNRKGTDSSVPKRGLA